MPCVSPRKKLSRRRFLAGSAAVAGSASLLPLSRAFAGDEDDALGLAMPKRPLGRTGERVGILALGTHPLGKLKDDALAVRLIERAIELGVNYLDTAPSYSRHRAERRVGAAVKGRRDKVLIATKSTLTPATKALEQLDVSLKALGTDHVDVFQIHAVGDARDRARKLDAEKGTLAAALRAKKAGKTRFIGVTGHYDPEVMAGCLAMHAFDTVLLPVNCADPLRMSFIEHALGAAREAQTAVVAMKVFAAGRLVNRGERATAAECLRFALSHDVATATAGVTSMEQLLTDVRAAKTFTPMPPAEREALTKRQAPHPGKKLEWYKRWS